jgi:hypothetical protein
MCRQKADIVLNAVLVPAPLNPEKVIPSQTGCCLHTNVDNKHDRQEDDERSHNASLNTLWVKKTTVPACIFSCGSH